MKKTLSLLLALGLALAARAAVQTDIEYGVAAGESLKLDAFVPEGAGPFPAVILVHGGGWTGGDKSGGARKNAYMVPMHSALEQAGFAWFSINYRLAPKHRYPACIDDVETAIRWVKANAAKYRIDPRRIALSGESAGGHLVQLAMVRMDESTRLAAVVPFYGRCDLIIDQKPGAELRTNLAALFGRNTFDDEARRLMTAASPLLHLKRGLPPVLLVHGTADASVPYDQSVAWQKRSRELGLVCDFITIKDGVHGMISWDAVAPTYRQDVVAWLVRTLRAPAAK
jgi:alpha-L-fucosidase 2